MKAWLCLVLAIQAFTGGCAQGYYESPPAYEAPAATNWYKNPETGRRISPAHLVGKLRDRDAASVQAVPLILRLQGPGGNGGAQGCTGGRFWGKIRAARLLERRGPTCHPFW